MEFEEGDVVLCTVDRIVGTTVFVKIQTREGEKEGSIVLSEIAAGRIRNLRDYVFPKKKIVCKILRISSQNNIELSLRRVTPKERKELMEEVKQENNYKKILKSVIGEKAEEIIKKIQEENEVHDFLEEAKTKPEKLEKLIGKKDSKKIIDILKTTKKKKASIKKEIFLTTQEPNGLSIIKEFFKQIKDVEVKYISAGKYTLKKEDEDMKKLGNEMKDLLKNLEENAKKNKLEFSIKEK